MTQTQVEPQTEAVTVEAIERQRELGWPDFHPETYCHRCGRLNVPSWYAPSPLWNAVMRDGPLGIVCPSCFAFLAESSGVVEPGRHTWRFAIEQEAAAIDAERLGLAMERACDDLSVTSLSPADAPVLAARLAAYNADLSSSTEVPDRLHSVIVRHLERVVEMESEGRVLNLPAKARAEGWAIGLERDIRSKTLSNAAEGRSLRSAVERWIAAQDKDGCDTCGGTGVAFDWPDAVEVRSILAGLSSSKTATSAATDHPMCDGVVTEDGCPKCGAYSHGASSAATENER